MHACMCISSGEKEIDSTSAIDAGLTAGRRCETEYMVTDIVRTMSNTNINTYVRTVRFNADISDLKFNYRAL